MEYNIEGELDFYYENLKVKIVNKNRDKQWLKSLFGNMVLNNNNRKEKNHKKGEIYFVRYLNRGFWDFLWNSVRTGLMDVAVPFYSHPDKKRQKSDPKYMEDR